MGRLRKKGVFPVTEREYALIQRLTDAMERMRLDDYLKYVGDRRRMMLNQLLSGIMRGLGFMIGFSVLGALTVVLLKNLVSDNLPLIGGFLAEVIHAIEKRL